MNEEYIVNLIENNNYEIQQIKARIATIEANIKKLEGELSSLRLRNMPIGGF